MYSRPEIRALGDIPKRGGPSRPLRARRVRDLQYILEASQGNTGLTLYAISMQFGVTPNHLSKTFKRAVGRSFRTLTVQARQRHAADLLETTDLAIKQIAPLAGYKHVSDFSSCFKRVYGVSPKEYRCRCTTSTKRQEHE